MIGFDAGSQSIKDMEVEMSRVWWCRTRFAWAMKEC